MVVEKDLSITATRREHTAATVADSNNGCQLTRPCRTRMPQCHKLCTGSASEVVEVDATEYPSSRISDSGANRVHLPVAVGLHNALGELDQLHVFFCRQLQGAVHAQHPTAGTWRRRTQG